MAPLSFPISTGSAARPEAVNQLSPRELLHELIQHRNFVSLAISFAGLAAAAMPEKISAVFLHNQLFLQMSTEWAHYFFKGKIVVRFTGAGDKDVDIAVFNHGQNFKDVWDGYQCKHYDNPLRPSDIYVELGKVLWFSFSAEYPVPRSLTFRAPCGIGAKLNSLL